MADLEENIKARIQPKIRAALETVAREKHPNGFRIDKEDFKKLMKIITIERIRSNDSCKPNAPPHAHRVCISVQADFQIRVYSTFPVKKGSVIGCCAGAAIGAVGGTLGGIGGGAIFGYVVSIPYKVLFGIICGVVGGIGSVIAGEVFGACIGAYAAAVNGAADSSMVCASQVFGKFEEYSSDETHNTCHCVLTTPTQCPSGDEGPDNENQNDTSTEL